MKDKIIKLMKEEGWKNIDLNEWSVLFDEKTARFILDNDELSLYFKKVKKFPKVFKGDAYTFKVNEEGDIEIMDSNKSFFILPEGSRNALKEVIKFSEEIEKVTYEDWLKNLGGVRQKENK